jgi:hypothetical protein
MERPANRHETISFEFTGGTGRFAHASGHGDFIGAINSDFIGTLEADGVISY